MMSPNPTPIERIHHRLKRIIQHMYQHARRLWSIFIPAFAVFTVGASTALSTLEDKEYQGLVVIILASLSLICLGIGVWAIAYDLRATSLRGHLHGYAVDMKRLLDNPSDYNNQQEFTLLEYRITAFIEIKAPLESCLWNKPLQDCTTLTDKIQKRISVLKSIIEKYESTS